MRQEQSPSTIPQIPATTKQPGKNSFCIRSASRIWKVGRKKTGSFSINPYPRYKESTNVTIAVTVTAVPVLRKQQQTNMAIKKNALFNKTE